MKAIYKDSWLSDDAKIQQIADSDGKPVEWVYKDISTGMVGEWSGFHFATSFGLECENPDCKVLARTAKIWKNDLKALKDFYVRDAQGVIHKADKSILCKAQLKSMTHRIKDSLPSWTFQKDTYKRHGDPILDDPNAPHLVIGAWIEDDWKGRPVNHKGIRQVYKDGFRWKVEVACFWWPDVFPFLRGPKISKYSDKKKVLYWEDISHLQAEIVGHDPQ